MPTITVTKGDDGRSCGLTDKDQELYNTFRHRLVTMTKDESVTFSWSEPRSGPYHRRHFAMINAVFTSQEKFEDQDHFRKWLEVGAGFCDLVPGPKGDLVAMPRSISYAKLDQAEFQPIHEAVFKFVRSEYARQYLWGHLGVEKSWQMVDAILREFEQ